MLLGYKLCLKKHLEVDLPFCVFSPTRHNTNETSNSLQVHYTFGFYRKRPVILIIFEFPTAKSDFEVVFTTLKLT